MSVTELRQRLSANFSRWGMTCEPRSIIITACMLSYCVMFWSGAYAQLKLSAGLSSYIRWCQAVARGSGSVLNVSSCLILLTSCRSLLTVVSGLKPFRGVNIVREINMLHSVIGFSIIIFAVLHTAFHVMWLIPFREWSGGLWKTKMVVSTGACLIPIIAGLLFSSLPRYRKACYRACKIVHIFGFAGYFSALMLHGVHNKRPETYKYMVPVLLLFLLDRCLARYRTVDCPINICAEDIEGVGRNVMKVTMPKPFDFRSGQFVEIMVKAVNTEWHAFTIASAPHENVMTVYMKRCGDWTEELYNIVKSELLHKERVCVEIKVRGPFGAPSQVARYYHRLVMVSGGIGATPFVSVCKEIMHKWQTKRDADPTMKKSSRWFVQVPPKICKSSNYFQTDLTFGFGQDKPVQVPRSHHFSSLRVVLLVLLLGKCFLRIASASLCSRFIDMRCRWTEDVGTTGLWTPIANIILEALILGCFGIYAFHFLKQQAALKPCICAQAFISASVFSLVLDICSLRPIKLWGFVPTILQSAILPILQVSLTAFFAFHFKQKYSTQYGQNCSIVDFVWVASNCDEDKWIRNELSTLRDVGPVRLRRFLTRQSITPSGLLSPQEGPVQNGEVKVLTSLGRPDWNTLLSSIAAETKRNEKIGLVFCGPSSMGDQIRDAAKVVSVASQLRGTEVHPAGCVPWTTHDQSPITDPPEIEPSHGKNIIFDVHREIFI